MKFSVNWINEFWQETLDAETLAQQLTSLGLEVEQVEPACNGTLDHVVVANIISAEPHPNADKLQVCQVSDGTENFQIVCGASNARAGINIPLAKIGAKFGDFKIKKAKLRGVESFGMLCSETEVGLADKSDGLMELADGAPLGTAIYDYLGLNDTLIEIDITPNRGDCLSLQGIARDIAAKNNFSFIAPNCTAVSAKSDEQHNIQINENEACLQYASRIIKNIHINSATPLWMSEKLRRSGIRSISPTVDITNFVMLELGQPMHAFDLDKVKGIISVRFASNKEKITLLDETEITLNPDTLVIADEQGAIAIAGIMGGLRTAVDNNTKNILLESAAFNPLTLAGKMRSYGLATDSGQRFERGVDYQLQAKAIERASQLIIDICSGTPCTTQVVNDSVPSKNPILLKNNTVERILGIQLAPELIEKMLTSLNMQITKTEQGVDVLAPSYRFDINIEADLVEEIARLYGYENIPRCSPSAALTIKPIKNKVSTVNQLKNLLVARGYTETVTYSFIDPKSFALFSNNQAIKLSNPISSELSVMRNSIWPGLLKVLTFNLKRQQQRVRIFEEGLTFNKLSNEDIAQKRHFAGLIYGSANSQSWSSPPQAVDFYDIKGDIESLLLSLNITSYQIQKSRHTSLHPGQSADIMVNDTCIGTFGRVHPDIEKAFDLPNACYVFEIKLDAIVATKKIKYSALSRYPSVKRDLSVVVKDEISAQNILDSIFKTSCNYLNDVKIFDVYTGKGVDLGSKSIALNIDFKSEDKTLTDEDINRDIALIITNLQHDTGAQLRD